jgi:hypothetical protein
VTTTDDTRRSSMVQAAVMDVIGRGLDPCCNTAAINAVLADLEQGPAEEQEIWVAFADLGRRGANASTPDPITAEADRVRANDVFERLRDGVRYTVCSKHGDDDRFALRSDTGHWLLRGTSALLDPSLWRRVPVDERSQPPKADGSPRPVGSDKPDPLTAAENDRRAWQHRCEIAEAALVEVERDLLAASRELREERSRRVDLPAELERLRAVEAAARAYRLADRAAIRSGQPAAFVAAENALDVALGLEDQHPERKAS